MAGAEHLVVFSEREERIAGEILDLLARRGKTAEAGAVRTNKRALEELARSISMYPSILEERRLGGSSRSIKSLIDRLCQREIHDMILHIPTKAILGRGFSIAKINFFLMLSYVMREMKDPGGYAPVLLSLVAENVSSITAEEVYISILEDMSISKDVRGRAVNLLAHTWEYRLGDGVKEFAPILRKLWSARGKLVPNFGTMLGFAELFVISGSTETTWFDFITRDGLSDEEVHSVEEFIFGLSHEEIARLREVMLSQGRTSLDKQEVQALMGPSRSFPEYMSDDPKELYRSFRDRKLHARFRKRAGAGGPKKTLEEYLMCFLLSVPDAVENGSKN